MAVSGGVDSMVMLDILATTAETKNNYAPSDISSEDNYASGDIKRSRTKNDKSHSFEATPKYLSTMTDIIVAHFDHGIRDNSDEDAEFVRRTSEKIYHTAYIEKKGNLPGDISEEGARGARYDFLRELMRQNEPAAIYTAHHLDDLLETVVINLLRGTGWRGLSVLDTPGIRRPLLEAEVVYEPMDKVAIYEYAAKKGLKFREDQSNNSDQYLRNRVRARLEEEDWNYEQKLKIWNLWQKQKALRREIDALVTGILPAVDEPWERKWFWDLENESPESQGSQHAEEPILQEQKLARLVAQELLRAGLLRVGVRATRPQIEDFRQAILTYAPGKKFNLPGNKLVKFTKMQFWLD